ncbi:hypothetical protein SKM62_06605 [Acinetobacter faecalis]|uniref:surface-adhesin E family protein n=1 Tax=Acinetobacter faecalis TaxID=2665161 RepID=UPI002A90E2A3|nr:surface-adhesin E family protein [Acinetobacter faecalis]MDY6536599.1 hypothetical protein [Acinetobacter faecalis]
MNKLFLAIMICGISSVQASEWEYLGETNEFRYEIDKQSIRKVATNYSTLQSNVKQFWVKKIVINDISKDGLGVGDHTKTLLHINCSADLLGFKTEIKYKGTMLIDSYTDPYVKMEPIIPDTIGSSFARSICN